MPLTLRTATRNDSQLITEIIAESARALSQSHYSGEQVEAALLTSFGLDTQLIDDKTYFLAYEGEVVAGCGGWSFRETLFGSDQESNRCADRADPATGFAKIRAFFIRPDFARKGVASLILQHCEREAMDMGFSKFRLMSTLPGREFYRRHGYQEQSPIDHPLSAGLVIRFVPMQKLITDSISLKV